MAGPNGTTEEGKANRLSLRSGRVGVFKECIAGPLDQADTGF